MFIYSILNSIIFRFSDFGSECFSRVNAFRKVAPIDFQSIEIKLVSDVTADSKVLEALKSAVRPSAGTWYSPLGVLFQYTFNSI